MLCVRKLKLPTSELAPSNTVLAASGGRGKLVTDNGPPVGAGYRAVLKESFF